MLPPVVASSSSPQLWKSQPPEQQLPSSSSNSSSPNVDHWFLPSSRLDSQTLGQALSCERRSCADPAPSSSSPKSLGNDAGLKRSDAHDSTASLRMVIHQQQQRLSGGLAQQKGDNAASSMATSDQLKETPGSPLKSSSASSSNSGTFMAVSGDGGAAFVPQQQQESGGNIRAATHVASFVKTEEGLDPANSSPWPTRIAAAMALSAPASVGAGFSKVSKRRSRASNKAPITVLSADTSNFRAMVQKLTGIPATSSPRASASSMQGRPEFQFWDSSAISILKPQPTRPSSHQSFHGGSLPTLDTSAPFLLRGDRSSSAFPLPARLLPSDNLLQATFPSLPFLQASQQKSDSSFSAGEIGLNGSSASTQRSFTNASSASDLKSLLQSNLGSSSASLPSLWDPAEGGKLGEKCFSANSLRNNWCNDRSGENSRMQALYMPGGGELDQFNMRQVSSIESFLMEDDRQTMNPSSRPYNSVDSWLSYDGVHGSKIELARNA